MTYEQGMLLWDALQHLGAARSCLNSACHRCGEISDEDYTRFRSAYSAVCEAIDKIEKV